MRIGIDISQIVHQGGVAVYTRNLVRSLLEVAENDQFILYGSSLRKYNHLNQFYQTLDSLASTNSVQKRFNRLPPKAAKFLYNDLHFPNIELFTGPIDVFHTSDWTEPKSRGQKVTTVHDLAPIIYPHLHAEEIVSVFKRKLSLVQKESDLIIADSKSTKKDLIKRFGINPDRVKVVYAALSTSFDQAPADQDYVEKLGLKNYIISDAARNPRKNLKNLLKAFLRLEDKQLKLVLLGDIMWAKKEMQSLLNKSGLEDRIITTGYVSDSKLKGLYKQAACAVFPSFYEGFGLNLLEAMSVDCPVVYADVSSLPEVGGRPGIKVRPDQPDSIATGIEKCLNLSAEKKKELTGRGRKQVAEFSWKKSAEKMLSIYHSLA
jgi:glycosyltransferase involved in cell wall biosynthesis